MSLLNPLGSVKKPLKVQWRKKKWFWFSLDSSSRLFLIYVCSQVFRGTLSALVPSIKLYFNMQRLAKFQHFFWWAVLKTTCIECLLYFLLTKRKEGMEEGGELDESSYLAMASKTYLTKSKNLSMSEDRRCSGFLKTCCKGTSTSCFFGKNR